MTMVRKLAIVERLDGHSETMGGFIALAQERGYETHLMYDRDDKFHMMDYYRLRMPQVERNIHDWSHIVESATNFDVIVLNTSDVWGEHAALLEKWNAEKRLIVVHHHAKYQALVPNVDACVFLTPYVGTKSWIFPLYAKPSRPIESMPPHGSFPALDAGQLPTLINIGTLRTKDNAAITDYAELGGRIVHYARNRCDQYSAYGDRFTQHIGLSSVELYKSLSERTAPIFLWCPVPINSEYTSFRFVGSLIVGVEMNCIMIMPERLRQLYKFPKNAVITYQDSIAEKPCLMALRASHDAQLERRRELSLWAGKQWHSNLRVFDLLLRRLRV